MIQMLLGVTAIAAAIVIAVAFAALLPSPGRHEVGASSANSPHTPGV